MDYRSARIAALAVALFIPPLLLRGAVAAGDAVAREALFSKLEAAEVSGRPREEQGATVSVFGRQRD